MSNAIEYALNRATQSEIAAHLMCCDDDFLPRLSDRIDIICYAHKVIGKATRFEAWVGGELIGLVAAYCNDDTRVAAYITNVSVLREWKKMGIATRLLEQCKEYILSLGFERIELEVDSANGAAISLYKKRGFVRSRVSAGRTVVMQRQFNKS